MAADERTDASATKEGADRRHGQPLRIERTRTGTVFGGAVAGLVLTMLMLVFVLQNDERRPLEFLWFDFELPTGVAILLAAVAGALIVSSLALGRVVQLRLAARRHRQREHGVA